MSYLDVDDPEDRARAIALGAIWICSQRIQRLACEDIASGRVPVPDYMSDDARDYINLLLREQGRPPLPEHGDLVSGR